ncbi:MAG: ParB/RepB/Spo0J family partition protein [Bradyrhizobium sp.]
MTDAITAIPLTKLVPWDGNVRKTGVSEGMEELVASIAAHGLLQSLIVRKTSRGKFAVIAGQRRLRALASLAENGSVEADMPVPCRIIEGSADAAEISLSENVVRAPMHPADQFDAFRELIDNGATPADIAARFGITEAAVKKRLKLARVSPVVFTAYRDGELTLEQVQAFAVSDDHGAQERVFADLSQWNDDADTIRDALTEGDIAATDKRVRFVTLPAYEAAGGAVRRDLFCEGDDGVFILDAALLDRLAAEKLEAAAQAVRAEGWKWVEAAAELDYETRAGFERRFPEPAPLSEEDAAEVARLTEEYDRLCDALREDDEEASSRIDEIEDRIRDLENGERIFTPETLSIAGAIVTIGHNGEPEVIRGLVRPEDAPKQSRNAAREKGDSAPAFSAALLESLTTHRSAALGATLAQRPDIALAAVAHAFALTVFDIGGASCVQVSATRKRHREKSKGSEALDGLRAQWGERIPGEAGALWEWCLAQDRDTLLDLLAFCAAATIDAVKTKHDNRSPRRFAHADALAKATALDMTAWFTPTAENFFGRVSKAAILSALAEAKGASAKRSWAEMKKAPLATLAEREIEGTNWLPEPLRP